MLTRVHVFDVSLRAQRNRFTLNLEVQLMLKQGQVEVEQGKFIPDYRDSLLVHRSVVEDLNSKVKDAAEFVLFATDTTCTCIVTLTSRFT